jgi:hypothetical protein
MGHSLKGSLPKGITGTRLKGLNARKPLGQLHFPPFYLFVIRPPVHKGDFALLRGIRGGENRRVFRQRDIGFAVEHLARDNSLRERAASILNCSRSSIRGKSWHTARI